MIENLIQRSLHKYQSSYLAQRAEANLISDRVGHLGTVVNRAELVSVVPQFVRTSFLCIDERIGRIVAVDTRSPVHRYTPQANLVNRSAYLVPFRSVAP